jgi:hypothetical protein
MGCAEKRPRWWWKAPEKVTLTSTEYLYSIWTPLARRTKSGSLAQNLMSRRLVSERLDEGWDGEPPVRRAVRPDRREGNRATCNLARG